MSAIKQIHFTICPTPNTSYIAHKQGWIKKALGELGVEVLQLQDQPKELWITHFNYKNPILFREGGNAPPIYAKADGQDVVLLGVTNLQSKQYIIARADSPVVSVEQLVGRKVGIPTFPNALIDFVRTSSLQAFDLALSARGVNISKVHYTNINSDGTFVEGGYKSLRDAVQPLERQQPRLSPQLEALDKGEVDAIYVSGPQATKLLLTGKYKVIFDLTAAPDVLAPINNAYPNVLTVHRNVAEKAPEVVVAYVRELLRAAEWAKTHYTEAVALLAEQTYATPGEFIASFDFGYVGRLAPELSDKSLAILDGRKESLLKHGFLKQDFSVYEWADASFLKAAQRQLDDENNLTAKPVNF